MKSVEQIQKAIVENEDKVLIEILEEHIEENKQLLKEEDRDDKEALELFNEFAEDFIPILK